jgi:anti-sigma factor RsiW
VNCSDATALLPWLLNGTLPAGEATEVGGHLRDCPACRRELAATREAWRLLDAHPAAAEVVAHALGPAATPPEVSAHLEHCPACRLEVALVREGGEGSAAEGPSPNPPPERVAAAVEVFPSKPARTSAARRVLVPAAALLAGIAGAGWLLTWQRLQARDDGAGARQASLERRVAELEAELHQALPPAAAIPSPPVAMGESERLAALETEIAALRQPRGVAVLELLPDEMVLRGRDAETGAIAVDRPATLLLVAQGVAAGSRYRIRVGGEPPVWQGILRADRAGELSLHLPAAWLPRGEHQVHVSTIGGEQVASYRLAVR